MDTRKVYIILILFIFSSTYAGIAMIQHAKDTSINQQSEYHQDQNDEQNNADENQQGNSENQNQNEEETNDNKKQDDEVSKARKLNVDHGNTVYKFNGTFDPEIQQISGTLIVKAINDTGVDQNSIYFHLYPMIYEEKIPLKGEDWDFIFGEKRTPGKMDVFDVKVSGKEVNSKIDGTIMEVPLESWTQNEEVSIEMSFIIDVPKNNGVFSYDDQSTWFGSWIPIKAVYTEEGWYLNPYHPIGDPLFSDIASYDMTIKLPTNYQIATSGYDYESRIVTVSNQTFGSYHVVAENVRDFAMVIMDDSYKLLQSKVDDVVVNVWYRNQTKEAMQKYLEATEKSLQYFSERYGKYPYKEFDVIATGGFFGGMEYPGLVFVQSQAFEKELTYGYTVIAHETAHQWWYALVGNNAIEEPWLDESLTNYSTLNFLLKHYPIVGEKTLNSQTKYLSKEIENFKEEGQLIKLPAKDFAEWQTYILSIYYFGSQMFYHLDQTIGEEKMNEALKLYVERYSYKNASREDLISVFEEVVGPQVREFFDSWLENEVVKTLGN
ncbi:hypothetical protein CIB95_12810 [Lottiidibacillus patelloidae]|uniref:Peptidase M1 membrane alanine aminopeptidase domain-containing protein n=1 Tax=Lottiidibacillus patelloidae TaxID=2670334 RepID=A0A263BRF0_9BACI|nr:M1 family metallopeptidase [Lottiidibacillus patelloidae]OZM56289.1 hypothetical protein CIB95_12810 [Lottiidibacillus patelloidae]